MNVHLRNYFLYKYIYFKKLLLFVNHLFCVRCYAKPYELRILIVMCECESWTIKKAECWRIDAFQLWCWRRILRVPWTARRSNQSILKEISPEYSLEGLILRLNLQYFGNLMWRANSVIKTLMLGKIEGRGSWGQQDEMLGWRHQLNRHEFEQAPGVGDGQGSLACCSPWGHKDLDTTEQLNNNSFDCIALILLFVSCNPKI